MFLNASQGQVYETVASDIVSSALNGYNGKNWLKEDSQSYDAAKIRTNQDVEILVSILISSISLQVYGIK